jgi:hypothetical protein
MLLIVEVEYLMDWAVEDTDGNTFHQFLVNNNPKEIINGPYFSINSFTSK